MALPEYAFPEIFENGIWASLSPSAKAVLPILYKHRNIRTGLAFPSVNRIMQQSGVRKVHTWSKALKELDAKGLIPETYLKILPGKGFRRKRIFRFDLPYAIQKRKRGAAEGHPAIKGASEGHPAIYSASQRHSKEDQREERNQNRTADFSFRKKQEERSPQSLINEMAAQFGTEAVKEALGRISRQKEPIRNMAAYFRETCRSVHAELRSARLEEEWKQKKELHAKAAQEAWPDLKEVFHKDESKQRHKNIGQAKLFAFHWFNSNKLVVPDSAGWSNKWIPALDDFLNQNGFDAAKLSAHLSLLYRRLQGKDGEAA